MLTPDQIQAMESIVKLQRICKEIAENHDLVIAFDIQNVIDAAECIANPPQAVKDDEDWLQVELDAAQKEVDARPSWMKTKSETPAEVCE